MVSWPMLVTFMLVDSFASSRALKSCEGLLHAPLVCPQGFWSHVLTIKYMWACHSLNRTCVGCYSNWPNNGPEINANPIAWSIGPHLRKTNVSTKCPMSEPGATTNPLPD